MHSSKLTLLKENVMKSSIRDTMEGTGHKAKGIVKESIGKLSDNPRMEVKVLLKRSPEKFSLRSAKPKRFLKSNNDGVSLCRLNIYASCIDK